MCIAMVSACASTSITTTAGDAATDDSSAAQSPSPDCVPDPGSRDEPLVGEDRRHENIEAFLTGYRLEDFAEGSAPPNDHPNWGGTWGDFKGGVVVAVLDCSIIDVNEVARLAGPDGALHIIEVPYTYVQVNEFRGQLRSSLLELGIVMDTPIDSTVTGRHIRVVVDDPSAVPADIAPDVPRDVFDVEQGPTFDED